MAGYGGLRGAAFQPRVVKSPQEIEAEQAATARAQYGDFSGGLASAVGGMIGSTKAYAASGLDAMGATGLAQGLYDSAAIDTKNAGNVAPQVATTDQITDGSTLGRYVAGKLGQGVGSLPVGLAGGVGGRLLTKSGAGALAGSAAAYQPVMAGGHVQELNANPNTAGMDVGEKFGRATGIGAVQSLAESVGPAYVANRFFKRNAPATSAGSAARNFGTDVAKGMALEGSGAAVSDVIGQGGMMHADPTVEYDGRQTFEAGIGEGIGGAGISVPGAAVANTLDYLNAGKDLAVDGARNVAGAAGDLGNPMSGVGGAALDAGKGALDAGKDIAQNVTDAGAMFKNTAAGYLKHPELAKLVAAQELPPEMEGKSQGEIIDWLAQDSGARHRAAIQIAQRTLIDREASDSEKAVAQQLLDNPTDPESWKPFADGMIAKHQIDRLGGKLGQAASELTKWVEEKRGKTKSNLERTPKDEADEREFISAMRRPIETAIGLQDSDTIVRIGSVLQNWVQNGFTPGQDGLPRIPNGLVEALGPKAHDVIAAAYATRVRQGKPLFDGDTRSPMGRKADEARALEAVKSAIAKKIARNDAGAGIVMKYLTPTMYEQATPESYSDIAEAVQYYLQNGDKPRDDHTTSRTTGRPRMQERNAAFEEEMQRHFGANADAVLEEIALLDKSAPQSSLGRGMADAAAAVTAPLEDVDGLQVAAEGETGSDADMTLEDSYNGGFTELNTDEDVRYLTHTLKKQPKAFDRKDAFVDEHVRIARKSLALHGRNLQRNRKTHEDQLKLDPVGVVDYASETGDRKILDELIAEHQDLSHEDINSRFFVMRNEASEVDQGEAVDVNPADLEISATKKVTGADGKERKVDNPGSWQARTRIDRPPEQGGNIDVSTIANGRLYLTKHGYDAPFVTSSRKLIEKMWDAKKLGAFDEKTADQVGAADKLAMFSAGLSSLMSSGVVDPDVDLGVFTGKIEVKTPDGEMYQVDSLDGLPDDFVIWDSNDEGAKLTLGGVKGLTNRGIRARKQKKLKGQEPAPKRESDRISIADIPDMTRTELRDAAEEMMGAFASPMPREAREALQAKLEAFVEAHGKRVTDRAPGQKKEQALEPAAKIAGTQTTIIDRDNNGDIFSKAAAAEYAGKNDRVVKRGDRWVVERDIGHKVERKLEHLTETEEMSAAVKEPARRFDEETGLEIQPRGKSTKGQANFLQQRVAKLRAEYKALAEQVAKYEAKEGKNAVREAALKRGHAKLAALVEQGKKLAAELAKLPPVDPKPTSTRAKEAAAEQKRKDALKPAFLRDARGESASAPAADANAARDIAYLEATIAAHHGEKSAAGAYEAAALPNHTALDQIAKAFGARVRGFKVIGDKAKYGFFSGVYQGGNRDVVYLSDAAKRPHMALLGHELVHRMRKTNPALYAKFEAAVSKHIKPDAYKAWSKMFPETGDKLLEEFMGEVVSDGMMDRTFWEALAKKDVSIAKQVYASVMRLFKQIMASVGYTPKTKSVLDDYAAVMKIAGEVMAEHGVTPEVVKFNMEPPENPTGEVMTPQQQVEAAAYIEKVLGPKVVTIFSTQMKGSGEWSRDAKNQKATIRIATTALNPLSVAHHEAMHEFFQRLLDGKYERAANVLRNAADSPLILRQLKRHFAGQGAVLEQIENDVEERIAYMFQLWASDKLDIGTQTETVFRKIINIIRKTLGLVSQEKQLEAILQSFHDGKMAEPGAMTQVLDSQEARAKYLKKIGKKANPALKKANEWVGFAESALTGSKNPHLDALGRTLNNKTGSKKDAQGFLSAKEQANNLYMNKFANALRGLDPTGKDKDVATKADVDLALEGLQTKTWHKDPLVLRIQQQVDGVFKEMMQYMKDAGVKVFNPDTKQWEEVREIKDYRIPRSWDPAKIIEHSGRFKELLLETHEGQLERIAKKANEEIADGKNAGDYTASQEKLANGDKTEVTAEDVATAITNRLINSNGQKDLKESATALGFSPFAKSVNEQTLDWIDEAVFAEFMEKDITKIISTYVGQITKRGEYSRRFGADGEVLQTAMDAALDFEIDQIMESKYEVKGAVKKAKSAAAGYNTLARKNKLPETTWQKELGKMTLGDAEGKDIINDAVQRLEPARRAIMAMEGTLGHDISVLARKASAYTIVYQNVRLLGYALFANLIDPLGMMVRGAEFKDAYGAFKRGMRDVTREWGDLTGIRKAKDSDRDDAVRVAEMIGTVDSSGFMSQMGTIYSSQYLPEWAKNANDTFFRWNGLEAFNKSMRVGATQAAISFIKRHYESPNEHSERYFEELGLTRADVQLSPDGELNVENRQVQQAVMRWVDGAILRPNAAIRPTMSSDPHYAVFYHLKQFMYAMHAVILKRVQVEIKNGNNDPLILLMAGYVPMMLAADSAKGLIQEATGNGQPYWQHDSIGGVAAHGVERAGLLGVGQLLADTVKYGPLGLLGPAVEQAADLVTQPLGDSVADATMVGPLSMALRGPSASSGSD